MGFAKVFVLHPLVKLRMYIIRARTDIVSLFSCILLISEISFSYADIYVKPP